MNDPALDSRRLAALVGHPRGGRAESVRRVLALLARSQGPVVEPIPGNPDEALVTFVWQAPGPVRGPSVFSPVLDFVHGETQLRPLARTGLWHRTFRFSRRIRASYGYSPRPMPPADAVGPVWGRYMQSLKSDPLNPKRIRFGPALHLSLLELPAAPAEPWSRSEEPSRWSEARTELHSRRLGNTRTLWIYRPPSFERTSRRMHLVILFDAAPYRDPIPAPRMVENLVDAGRIGPTALVLVDNAPGARERDLLLNPKFPDFLARELLPLLRKNYGIVSAPERTVVAGSSFGAVAAAYAALRYPRRFGNVLAQSGSFSMVPPLGKDAPPTLMQQFAHAPLLPIHFYLDAGTREGFVLPGSTTSLLESVRHLRDVLEAKGYSVKYAEFEGGHDYACWRGTLAEGLVRLIGG